MRIASNHKAHWVVIIVLLLTLSLSLPTIQAWAAATGTHTPVTGVTVSVSGATDNSMSNGAVTVTAKGSSGFLGMGGSSKTATITIYNDSTNTAQLSFDWTATSVNQLKIDGTEYAGTSGSVSKVLGAGKSFVVTITTAKNGTTNKLVMSNFSLTEAAASSNVTFDFDSALGSITVGGAAVANGATKEIGSAGSELVATPNSGVTFLGWVDTADNSVLSTAASYTLTPVGDMTVKAAFASPNAKGWFQVGAKLYDDLNAAATEANGSANKTIILAANGMVPAGNYTIPSGVTLLIPFDAANTLYTTTPGNDSSGIPLITLTAGTYSTPTKYRELTLASGANITVNGAISLSAKHHAPSGGKRNAGAPTGPCSFMNMLGNSSITIENGGKLYAWGFITGSGSITAKSGATVYEYFQIQEHRGGTVITDMLDSTVFPFSQYYVQNIEVSLTLEKGATERGYSSLIVNKMVQAADVPFVGGSDCMFYLSEGSLTKKYDGTKDRLYFTINGACSVSPMELNIGATINTKNFVLPFNGNITVEALAGSKLNILQDIALLPGSEVILRENSTCTLGSGAKLYVYDADQWVGYVMNDLMFYSVSYAPGRTYTRTEKDMKDAVLQVDGTLDARQGYLYTTQGTAVSGAKNSAANINITDRSGGGANICSTGTGKIILPQISEGVTIQYNSSLYYYIPISSAQLKNGDGSYCKTGNFVATDDLPYNTYTYTNGKWMCSEEDNGAGHSYESVVTAPTCTEAGYATYTCSVCGDSYTEPIAATGHRYSAVVTAPTCTEEGYTTYTCTDCNDSYVADKISALGHKYSAVVTEPTCTNEGYTTHTCTGCNHSYVDSTVPALGHRYDAVVTKPTCTDKGYTTHTCSTCGGSYKDAYVDALGHTEVIDAAVDATCNKTGLKEGSHCSVCNEVLVAQEVTPATGLHTHTDDDYICEVCNLFQFLGSNVFLGNNLDMWFAFPKAAVTGDLTGYYAIITQNGDVTTIKYTAENPWQVETVGGVECYIIIYGGIAAKEMSDLIEVTVYNAAGEPVSSVKKDSIRDYAHRLLNLYEEEDTSKNQLRTLLVDMLNYGAACQTYFASKDGNVVAPEDLANYGLTDAEKAFATAQYTWSTDLYTPENDYLDGANLITTSNVQFAIKLTGEYSKVTYDFEDHWGIEYGVELELKGGYDYYVIDTLVVADAKQTITIQVYSADGILLAKWEDSIESYCKRMYDKATVDQKEVYHAFMKFASAAHDYLEGGNRVE